ncbi:hypothetical protein J132_10162 [Termitomyces sp. J132]|nr:hypothetical protein J132_10162 [Termitomyces sp. J132]
MKFCATLATLAFMTAGAVAQFMINTPFVLLFLSPYPFDLDWGHCILPGSQPNGQALEDLGMVQSTQFSWTVNIPAGTSIGLTLRDSTGQIAQSAAFTINPGNDNSCLGQSSSAGATTAGNTSPASSAASSSPVTSPGATSTPATSVPVTSAPATSTATSATSAPATSGLTSATRPTTPGSSAAISSSGPSSTVSPNAAPTQAVNFGAAALLGAAVALLA